LFAKKYICEKFSTVQSKLNILRVYRSLRPLEELDTKIPSLPESGVQLEQVRIKVVHLGQPRGHAVQAWSILLRHLQGSGGHPGAVEMCGKYYDYLSERILLFPANFSLFIFTAKY
jgi:hypothetical protein